MENKLGTPKTTTLLTPSVTTSEISRATTPGTPDTSYTPIKMNIFHQVYILVLQSLLFQGHQRV